MILALQNVRSSTVRLLITTLRCRVRVNKVPIRLADESCLLARRLNFVRRICTRLRAALDRRIEFLRPLGDVARTGSGHGHADDESAAAHRRC